MISRIAATLCGVSDRPEDFASVYAELEDEALVELARASWSLTDEALASLTAEFARRHITMPEPETPPSLEYQRTVTVRQFRDPSEAMVAKSVLDSAGIECFLRDENTVRLDWGISNMIGGIRLQVAPEDVDAAEDLLSQPIPESFAVESEEDYRQPRCPRCGSLDVGFEGLDQKAGMAAMFLLSLPVVLVKNSWRCHRCNAEWKEDPDE